MIEQQRGGSSSSAMVPSESNRPEALSRGVRAVVETMSGEVQFANDNERAFALFRKGCRHCAELPTELEAVGPKDIVVAFLARVAQRRSACRQVQELSLILVQVPTWRDLLMEAPQQLLEVLHGDAAVHAVFAAACAPTVSPAPKHEARVFLREAWSKRFLSIMQCVESERKAQRCVMTERAASLLVCHCDGRRPTPSVDDWDEEEYFDCHPQARCGAEGTDGTVLGFAHEGVPSPGCFLACKRPRRRLLRDVVTGGGDPELCCTSQAFGRQEEFFWCTDATIRHISSGLWLFVDASKPEAVTMHKWEKSYWEALPAL